MDTIDETTTLGEYLKEKLGDRGVRDLAEGAGIGMGTASRLLKHDRHFAGIDKPTPDTLQAVADYLNVPVEILFRLAGYLPPEEAKSLILREIEYLLARLPPDDQEEIREMARLKAERRRKERERKGETGSP